MGFATLVGFLICRGILGGSIASTLVNGWHCTRLGLVHAGNFFAFGFFVHALDVVLGCESPIANQALRRITGLRSHAQPIVNTLQVQLQFRFALAILRIIGTENLQEPAIPLDGGRSHHHTIKWRVLGAVSL